MSNKTKNNVSNIGISTNSNSCNIRNQVLSLQKLKTRELRQACNDNTVALYHKFRYKKLTVRFKTSIYEFECADFQY